MPVGVVQGGRRLPDQATGARPGQRSFLLDHGGQVPAGDELHDQAAVPIHDGEVVDVDDVGVLQVRQGIDLVVKTTTSFLAGQLVQGDDLDGDGAVEAKVQGPVD